MYAEAAAASTSRRAPPAGRGIRRAGPARPSSRRTSCRRRSRRPRARTRVGSALPSKRTSPYGSSSRTSRPALRELGEPLRAARAATSARSGSGTSESCTGTLRSSTVASSSSGTGITSAPSEARIFSGRSYVGASTSTGPFGASSSATNWKPWSEPFVSTTRAGSTPWRSAIHSRSSAIASAGPVAEDGLAVAVDRGPCAVGQLRVAAGTPERERRGRVRSTPCGHPKIGAGHEASRGRARRPCVPRLGLCGARGQALGGAELPEERSFDGRPAAAVLDVQPARRELLPAEARRRALSVPRRSRLADGPRHGASSCAGRRTASSGRAGSSSARRAAGRSARRSGARATAAHYGARPRIRVSVAG